MAVEGGTLERLLGHKDGALVHGITTLGVPSLLPPQREVSGLQPRRGPSSELDHAITMILDCKLPEL